MTIPQVIRLPHFFILDRDDSSPVLQQDFIALVIMPTSYLLGWLSFLKDFLAFEISLFYLTTGEHGLTEIGVENLLRFTEPKCALVVKSHRAEIFEHFVFFQSEGFGDFQHVFREH